MSEVSLCGNQSQKHCQPPLRASWWQMDDAHALGIPPSGNRHLHTRLPVAEPYRLLSVGGADTGPLSTILSTALTSGSSIYCSLLVHLEVLPSDRQQPARHGSLVPEPILSTTLGSSKTLQVSVTSCALCEPMPNTVSRLCLPHPCLDARKPRPAAIITCKRASSNLPRAANRIRYNDEPFPEFGRW